MAAKRPPAGVLIKVGSLLDEGMMETARADRPATKIAAAAIV
jgi:hypothetical protein